MNVSLTYFIRKPESSTFNRRTLFVLFIISVMIIQFVPWQSVFFVAWVVQLYACATSSREHPSHDSTSSAPVAIPLLHRNGEDDADNSQEMETSRPTPFIEPSNYYDDELLLLFMTWLLPFSLPVIVVWIKTLITAGITAPFAGDHNPLHVLPFLLLLEARMSGSRSSFESDGLVSPSSADIYIKAQVELDQERATLG